MRDVADQYADFENRQGYTQPSPEDMILNGEMGTVKDISEDGSFYIDVGDRVVFIPATLRAYNSDGFIYKLDVRTSLELGYAVTTHKAQGSEWEHVVYVMTKSTSFMHSRQQFYTAITRASKKLCVITDSRSVVNAVRK